MYLSELPEFFFSHQLLSVPYLVRKREHVFGYISQSGQHLFPVREKEKNVLMRKHKGSWQAVNSQSNEEKTLYQLLAPGHIHNRKERAKIEQLSMISYIRSKENGRTSCSSFLPGSPLTTFLLSPFLCDPKGEGRSVGLPVLSKMAFHSLCYDLNVFYLVSI